MLQMAIKRVDRSDKMTDEPLFFFAGINEAAVHGATPTLTTPIFTARSIEQRFRYRLRTERQPCLIGSSGGQKIASHSFLSCPAKLKVANDNAK